MDTEGHFQKIIAKAPLAELHDLSSTLRSISQGRAKFKIKFDSYAPVAYDIQRKLK
jgi:elongation factor G